MGLVKSPVTFLQLLLSPPHTPHLSNFFLEPRFPSQPALMHLPWTQTEVESGVHGVPSTTCSTPAGDKDREGSLASCSPKQHVPALLPTRLAHLGCQHIEVASAIGSANELALVLGRNTRVLGYPGHGKCQPIGAVVVTIESLTLLLPEALARSWEGRRICTKLSLGRGAQRDCFSIAQPPIILNNSPKTLSQTTHITKNHRISRDKRNRTLALHTRYPGSSPGTPYSSKIFEDWLRPER